MPVRESGTATPFLLCIRRGQTRACIGSAGTVAFKSRDEEGRDHLVLIEENAPETLDLIICHARYVITQEFLDGNICRLLRKYYGATQFVVSYGTILEDHHARIPWPHH
ncbi:hypothetical protein BXY53_1334 [Dichotomicrobium thermohalophilum]|uniref:Uncharacterized protein n=1 Tax=Dichotomicrobium thermohalophilum TaxID=933063 RepID=A0A397Q550_9HYPH|nr:hypothetical protein BXY53_1334 [Dichotomicrobium thermohalophilum]